MLQSSSFAHGGASGQGLGFAFHRVLGRNRSGWVEGLSVEDVWKQWPGLILLHTHNEGLQQGALQVCMALGAGFESLVGEQDFSFLHVPSLLSACPSEPGGYPEGHGTCACGGCHLQQC